MEKEKCDMMKQINNGFPYHYYITEEGDVVNEKYNRKLSPSKKWTVTLMTINGQIKHITIKKLYRLAFDKEFCKDNVEDLPEEYWKEIAGSQGRYLVSNLGRVKSLCDYEAKIIKPAKKNSGYDFVRLSLGEKIENVYIHRLVAAAFVPNDDERKTTVDHINGIKRDNRAVNLRWLSRSENTKEYYRALNTKQQEDNQSCCFNNL